MPTDSQLPPEKPPETTTAQSTLAPKIPEETKPEATSPAFTRGLMPQTVNEGENVVFDCEVEAVPEADILWLCEDKLIEKTENLEITYKSGICTLKITNVTTKQKGLYRCVARNVAGETSTSATLSVTGMLYSTL